MTADVPNTVGYANGDLKSKHTDANTGSRKSKVSERGRRRRKQKKNNKVPSRGVDSDTAATDEANGGAGDTDKENSDLQKSLVVEQVEVEYVPEKAELDGELDEEFRKVFEKFSFTAATGSEENDKKDETAADAALKKKDDSDSEEEQDAQPREKGISNKKKKLQRRMNIAELKQICTRPDVVEVWDATAADPKLLVYLKSYRNTVPVPRHWSQKRKFLQEGGLDIGGASTWETWYRETAVSTA
ncbi:hypothetical protein AABB24_004917 [Solanum stoloniferum]|uniref:DUF382 domain-containing protein n=1 Tax=Solanum stoloniferum TaxID=62892 RepID=A0ABD2UVL1_9SOLN